MGKGSARFGNKSGVLPEVRQIFKKPIKPVVRPVNPNAGYAEGVPHPKGTSREQPLPTVQTPHQLISQTVKAPKETPDLQKLSEAQKEKVRKAALRREYYVQSLQKEERKLEAQEKRQKYLEEKEAQRKAEQVHEITDATRLTLPTIDNVLEGPFMRQRTEEEKQILQAKRTANRLNNELIGKTNRAVSLLELYYEAENYITTESELNSAIEAAFSKDHSNQIDEQNPEVRQRSHNSALQDALFGTISSNPGLVDVEEHLSGKSIAFDKLVDQAIAEKAQRDMENARTQE